MKIRPNSILGVSLMALVAFGFMVTSAVMIEEANAKKLPVKRLADPFVPGSDSKYCGLNGMSIRAMCR